MKKRKKQAKKNRDIFSEQEKDIGDLIDDLAYLDEKQNINRSRSFLDNMYRLNDE